MTDIFIGSTETTWMSATVESQLRNGNNLAIQVWEEEGGYCRPADAPSKREQPVRDPADDRSITQAPGLGADFGRLGYSQEELYFHRREQELKERRKRGENRESGKKT